LSSLIKGQKEKEDAKVSIIAFKKAFLRESKNKLLSYRYIMGHPNLTPVNPLI
jgi:hypothetical protein